MHDHLQKCLVAYPFAAGNLARFVEIRRGQAQRDLNAGRPALAWPREAIPSASWTFPRQVVV
jgi:hypothetical protein